MRPIMRRRERRAAPACADFMTTREHRLEAERLSWVIDDVIQSPAKRTLGDLIALARLHLELAQAAGKLPGPSAEEWACQQCRAAYFGPLPEDGLCPACQTGAASTSTGHPPAARGCRSPARSAPGSATGCTPPPPLTHPALEAP